MVCNECAMCTTAHWDFGIDSKMNIFTKKLIFLLLFKSVKKKTQHEKKNVEMKKSECSM